MGGRSLIRSSEGMRAYVVKTAPIPIGTRFGSLEVSGSAMTDGKRVFVPCKCDCGATPMIRVANLHGSKRCGACIVKHGRARTKLYKVWASMRSRCNDTKDTGYHKYGARGIRVCERWSDFSNFLADMGERPSGMSLDRIDNDGNYEPGNVRWATSKEQASNTRHNVLVTRDGRTQTMSAWAREIGVSPCTIRSRLATYGAESSQFAAPPCSFKRISTQRGSHNGHAKITEAVVPTIRDRISAGDKLSAIASDYGVSVSCISLIGKRRSWRHVK